MKLEYSLSGLANGIATVSSDELRHKSYYLSKGVDTLSEIDQKNLEPGRVMFVPAFNEILITRFDGCPSLFGYEIRIDWHILPSWVGHIAKKKWGTRELIEAIGEMARKLYDEEEIDRIGYINIVCGLDEALERASTHSFEFKKHPMDLKE